MEVSVSRGLCMTLEEETSTSGNLCVQAGRPSLEVRAVPRRPQPAGTPWAGRLPPGLAWPKVPALQPVPTLGASHELHDAVC